MYSFFSDFKKYISILLAFFLAGCMVGPDFRSPAAPKVTHYIEQDTPKKTSAAQIPGPSGKAQYFRSDQSIPAQWWHVFHSPELNMLILRALANSPDLASAKASLNQAHANYAAQFGTLFPVVTGNASAQRERFSLSEFGGANSTSLGTNVFNLYNVNVAVSYTLDVFGGLRRQIEAAGAQVDYQRFELEAAYLTLSANIVTTSITIASLRAQINATQQLIRAQEKTLALVKKQSLLGGASQADVFLQENQLEQTRATLPPLAQSLAVNLHSLSMLIGELPREESLPELDLNSLHLPQDLPLTCPSSLVRQRPDIQAAEAVIHSASAQIGVAIANMLPQVNLTGNYGWQSTKLSDLFRRKNSVWDIAAAVAQPIFNGGSLIAKKRAAIAVYEQAAALYKQTVLQAFQNVADTLRALEHDAQLLKTQRAAEVAASNSLNLTRKQFRLGGVSYLSLLIAERTYQQAIINRIQVQAARYTDTAALFQALGGGWWNRPSLECSQSLIANTNQYRPGCFGKDVTPLKRVG